MARNRNSTALFDVIHAAKKPPKSSPSASIPAPRWWGKDKKPLKPAPADPTENVGKQRSWLSAARQNAGLAAAPVSVPVDPVVDVESAAPPEPMPASDPIVDHSDLESAVTEPQPAAPRVRFIDRFVNRTPKPELEPEPAVVPYQDTVDTTEPQAADSNESMEPAANVPLPMPVFYKEADEPAAKPEARPARAREKRDSTVALDSASGEVRFRLSYGGIIAFAFILMLALAIAFIAGKHAQSDTAISDPDPKAVPSTAGMMASVSSAKPGNSTTAVQPTVIDVSPKKRTPAERNAAAKPPGPVLPLRTTREIGTIYVVVQSYPDKNKAQEACDFLNADGVKFTLVKGLSGHALRDWYSVVGLRPFKKLDSELQEYERSLTATGLRFSSNFLDQFQPKAYVWRADSQDNDER